VAAWETQSRKYEDRLSLRRRRLFPPCFLAIAMAKAKDTALLVG
jgi:hypothetical protein